ncbi:MULTISPECIES: condensation domain-containing protein [unclassified Kitasatospora]|uniref:condensation domain-containing protein n=1 Tax=unclassified Kitasatospora TaxID=2633591 RepID=UPI000A71EDFE|nr:MULTISPECIES: condensation domain-containing protein [unclassified Kitasatospora]
MTWGQQAIWTALQKLRPGDHAYNVPLDGPVPGGMPLEVIERAFSGLLYVHDALRTRVVAEPDGELRQHLDGDGGAPLHLRHGTPEQAAGIGAALREELWGRAFDYADEWPVRFGAVVSEGLVHHVVLIFSHTAADAWGLPRLQGDLQALSLGADPVEVRAEAERAGVLQTLEQAAEQASPRGRRLDAAARRQWRSAAAGARAPQIAPAPPAGEPRYRRAHLLSPALPGALARVCETHRTSTASILLAATAETMADWAGTGRCGLQLMVNNRFHSGLGRAGGPLAMEGYLAVRTEGAADFGELLARTRSASLATYRSAFYDKRALEADLAPYAEDAGVTFERSCWYNDQRVAAPEPASADWSSEAAGESTLSWEPATDHGGTVSYVLHMADKPDAIEIAMTADTHLFTPADMERLLRTIERTVLDQAATYRPAQAG